MTECRWPDRLWIVRHGESAGNVARDAAYASGLHVIDIAHRAGGDSPDAATIVDERLREKEFGILDRLTKAGIAERYPDQAARRARMGKFHHRPPAFDGDASGGGRLRLETYNRI